MDQPLSSVRSGMSCAAVFLGAFFLCASAPPLSFAQSTVVNFEDVDTSQSYPPVGERYVDKGLFMEMGEAANSGFPPGPWLVGPWAQDVSVDTFINKAMCPARAAHYQDCGWEMDLKFIEPGNPQSSALARGVSVDVLFMHLPGTVRVSWLNENGNVIASQTNQNFIGYDANCVPQCDLPGCADGHQTFVAPGRVSGVRIGPTGVFGYPCQGPETYWIDNITFELNDDFCLNAGAAHCDHNPKDDRNLGCDEDAVGNPCSAATGNKFQREIDYTGARMSFSRSYNSGLADMDIGLGFGWTSNYHKRIEAYIDGILWARRTDGHGERFIPLNPGWQGDNIDWKLVQGANGYTLTLPDKTVELYDLSGRILSETRPNGYGLTYTYSVGRLQQVRDTFGATLSFSYDSNGRLHAVADPANQTIATYAYDGIGNLISATDSSNAVRTYVYENSSFSHHLTGIIDEVANRYATWGYDAFGRASLSEHAGGAGRVTLSHNPGVQRATTTVTDALNTSRVYNFRMGANRLALTGISQPCSDCDNTATKTYEYRGNVASRVDFEGNRTCYAYDYYRSLETVRVEGFGPAVTACPADLASYSPAAGTRERKITTTWHPSFPLPTSIVRANRTTEYTYDATGNVLTKIIRDTGSRPRVERSWTYTYNDYGQILTENGPRTDVNDVTTYTYYLCSTGAECGQVHTITNALGQVTTYDSYNVHGQPLSITDPNGVVTTLTYDERQRLTSRTVGGESTLLVYWPTGQLRQVTLPGGSYLLYTYDAAHRLVRMEDAEGNYISFTLDAMGNRTAENIYDPSNALTRTRTRVFDALNHLHQEIGAAGTPNVTTTFAHDDNGNQTGINAPLNRHTANAFDEFNRLVQITDPGSGITRFSYNANDNLVSVTDPRGLVTSYAYTGFGDLRSQTNPDAGTTTYAYDSGGNLKTSTDARKAIATYTYDALNRVTSAAFKIGKVTDQTITYSYDSGLHGRGHLTGVSDVNHSLNWTYDAQGRVTGKTQTVGAVTQSVGYGYNAARLVTMTMPSGQVVTYGYNSNNQIVSVQVGSTTILSDAIYEPFGPVRGWTWGNSTIMARTYDTDGNLTQFDSGGFKAYSYDDAFRITGITDADTSANSYIYGYDALDRITSASKPGVTFGWIYDANGNRLSQTGSGASTYTISASSNRINSISGALARTYTYNAIGSVTGYTAATATYNNSGRMKTLTRAGVTATYVYDALGRRIRQSGGTPGTVLYMYDEKGHLVGEYTGTGALVQETVWLGDIPVATLRPSGNSVSIYYVHTDHLNTPIRITRPSDNALVWAWNASPFGADVPNENPQGAGLFRYNLRFAGQIYDSHAGLHYNYFRDYDPAIGRYVESDPLGLIPGVGSSQSIPGFMRSYFSSIPLVQRVAKGINQPYTYVGDNPIALIDPLGLYGDCSYYAQRCAQVGGIYYCYIAPAGCKAFPDTGWSSCVRECLQRADRRVCNTCGGGADVWCTIGAHEYCWLECTKNTSDPPPL